MLKHDRIKTKSRVKKPRKQWWEYLEPVFVSIALFTAIVACSSLTAWSFISFAVPPSKYQIKTELKELSNGQYLQVEYPNLVLGGNDPAYIILTISGNAKTKDKIDFEVELPPGLTLIEPVDQATNQSGKVTIEEPDKIISSEEFTLGVINSQAIWDYHHRTQSQPLSVKSASLDDSIDFSIDIETVPWISARGLVSSTFNERSPLILLVTGFLSGAGALVFQFAKSRQDVAWAEQQKKEKDFAERLKEDLMGAIKFFINSDHFSHTGKESDFDTYKRLIELSGWEDKLPAIILDRLKARKNYEAKQVAENLNQLCNIFVPKPGLNNKYDHLRSFDIVCDLILLNDYTKRTLTKDEASCILTVYKHWQELKPIITNLIYKLSTFAKNLPPLNDIFVIDDDGLQLLKDANIQKFIDDHVSRTEDGTEENKAAYNIKRHLALDIEWRPLWSGNDRKLSEKVQRWLAGYWLESVEENFSLGSEYAELDGKLKEQSIEHPVLKQMDGPFPGIVFGDEGTGKTACALQLVAKHRRSAEAESKEPKVFPVYAPFEAGVDLKEWLVEKISRALIEFTADNPRRFLIAPESQKTAMSRLILRYTQNEDALRLSFYSSSLNNSVSDTEQAIEYIRRFKHRKTAVKLSKQEMLNLLYAACPDIFDQIYFLWDIRSASPQDEVINKIKEMDELAVPLASQKVYIKVFAPLTVKPRLRNLQSLRSINNDITWDNTQLVELMEKRMEKFNILWRQGGYDPIDTVIATSKHSPRRLIRLMIHLMDHVDEHLQENDYLDQSIFEQVRLALEEKE